MSTETTKFKEEVSQLTQDVSSAAAEAARSTLEKLGLTRDQIAERYHSATDASYQYVVKHPAGTLAAVAVLGVALGYLLGHRGSNTER